MFHELFDSATESSAYSLSSYESHWVVPTARPPSLPSHLIISKQGWRQRVHLCGFTESQGNISYFRLPGGLAECCLGMIWKCLTRPRLFIRGNDMKTPTAGCFWTSTTRIRTLRTPLRHSDAAATSSSGSCLFSMFIVFPLLSAPKTFPVSRNSQIIGVSVFVLLEIARL